MHRTVLGAIALAAALLIAAPTIALAATPAPSASNTAQQTGSLQVPLIGNGTNAIATITNFQVVDGALMAVGTITGTVVTTTGQVLNLTDAPFSAPVTNLQSGATCEILTLDLGAIHLDVLGLVVDLSPVHLNIAAQPGSGNLLGNLLCAVAHLLDNGSGGALNGVANLLNRILAIL